jgi:hypothetical protein
VDRVKSYRGTFAYEKALRKRRVWVEPLFGEAKEWHGLRRFRLPRLEKVNIEALLMASGQNMKRLVADRGPRTLAQAAALRPPDPVSRCRPHLTGWWPSFFGAKAYFNRLYSLDEAWIGGRLNRKRGVVAASYPMCSGSCPTRWFQHGVEDTSPTEVDLAVRRTFSTQAWAFARRVSGFLNLAVALRIPEQAELHPCGVVGCVLLEDLAGMVGGAN